jgi:hypothetical protein
MLAAWSKFGLALARLARRYAVTHRTLIERLVIAEDERILAEIELDSAQWHAYFADTSLRSNDDDHMHEKGENIAPARPVTLPEVT